MSRTLLDVAPYRITPPISGGTLAIHHANLAVANHWSVHLISQGVRRHEIRKAYLIPVTKPPMYQHTPTYLETCVFSLPTVLLGYYFGQRSGGSLLSADWTLRLTRPRVLFEALEHADILQAEHPWQVPALARWNRGRRPLVTVAHNVETLVVERLGRARREVEATRRREIEAVRLSDAVIAFTEDDRQGLLEMTSADEKTIHTIPLGVDTERIKPSSVEAKERAKASLGLEGKRVALFIGALYEPNIQAVSTLVDLAARLDRKELLFVVVGRVGELFQSNDRVLVTGQVDDVLPYIAAADLAVNPMRSGGGMQVKLLEFLAAGLPTVTTPVGARGLAAKTGEELMITDLDSFPDAIEHLLKDQDVAGRIGSQGRQFVVAQHGWAAIARSRVALYESLVVGVAKDGSERET